MTLATNRPILALALTLSIAAAARGEEANSPEITALRVGFAGRYKVGLWTPLEVTLRGGSAPASGIVRATLCDGDGLNCSYEADGVCQAPAGQETSAMLYVRFGRRASTVSVELIDPGAPGTTLAAKTFDSAISPKSGQFPESLRGGQRLIVSIGEGASGLENAVPNSQGAAARNAVALVDDLAHLPTRWEGYEGVDSLIISTDEPALFAGISPEDARIVALDEWVRMGGTLVLSAGSHAAETLRPGGPLASFVPGHYEETMILGQTSGWESYAKSVNPIPPLKAGERVELPTARLRLADVQGRIEARQADVPLVVRSRHGLGQVVFVATDVDRGPILAWTDRSLLIAAILNLPPIEQAGTAADVVESYGYNDLAGQLRSALDDPRGVRLVPFFAVALAVIAYVLLIGPGDYFLLRRLGRGMQWTWVTFPAIAAVFAAGAYCAAYWLKGDRIRVSQLDLIDIDASGTARGATWFSIFSPRGESFDLSVRPCLPGGQLPRDARASLAWLGKAGDEFNGMYGRDAQAAPPAGSEGYAIAPPLDAVLGAPIQVWSSKNFVQRWLGHAPQMALDSTLEDDGRQLSGTIINRLAGDEPQGAKGAAISRCYLVYDGWAYIVGTMRPGESVEIGPATRRVSLNTFMSGDSFDLAESKGAEPEKSPYDRGSRDMAYVMRQMLFYDAAGGRKRTGMANDYQGFTDLSGLLKTGCAILVALPERNSYDGGELLRGPAPKPGEADIRQSLGEADRHATIYRFVLPVSSRNTSAN